MADENLAAWIAVYNHDLGLPAAYDAAVLWLQSLPTACLWLEHVQVDSLLPTLRRRLAAFLATEDWGSIFLLYAEHENVDFVLAFWELESADGRPMQPYVSS